MSRDPERLSPTQVGLIITLSVLLAAAVFLVTLHEIEDLRTPRCPPDYTDRL